MSQKITEDIIKVISIDYLNYNSKTKKKQVDYRYILFFIWFLGQNTLGKVVFIVPGV